MVGISESDGGRTSVISVVPCLVAAVCCAAEMVCQKLTLRHASAVQVTGFGCFTGTAACLPFAVQFLFQFGSAPVPATLQVVYLRLLPTTLGFTTWAYALARTTSGRMGATIYAVSTLVFIMSWLILAQSPDGSPSLEEPSVSSARCIAFPLTQSTRKLQPSQLEMSASCAACMTALCSQ